MYIALMTGLVMIAVGSGYVIAQLYLTYHPRLSRLQKIETEEQNLVQKKIEMQEKFSEQENERNKEYERKKEEWKKEIESLRNKNRSNRAHIGQLKKDINRAISILNQDSPNTGYALRVLRKAYERKNK